MAKFDLKAAYRNVPVQPKDRWLLGMVWGDKLYVDSVLPFGLRSASAIFNAVAEGLSFVIRSRGVGWLRHYLDDFIIVGPPGSGVCGDNLSVALDTCSQLGVPVAAEKMAGYCGYFFGCGGGYGGDGVEVAVKEVGEAEGAGGFVES